MMGASARFCEPRKIEISSKSSSRDWLNSNQFNEYEDSLFIEEVEHLGGKSE